MFLQVFTSIDKYVIVNIDEIRLIEEQSGFAMITLKDDRVIKSAEPYAVLLDNLLSVIPSESLIWSSPQS